MTLRSSETEGVSPLRFRGGCSGGRYLLWCVGCRRLPGIRTVIGDRSFSCFSSFTKVLRIHHRDRQALESLTSERQCLDECSRSLKVPKIHGTIVDLLASDLRNNLTEQHNLGWMMIIILGEVIKIIRGPKDPPDVQQLLLGWNFVWATRLLLFSQVVSQI